ncbi:MAG: ABC transporter ATP-binding protein [Acidobacteria bacterium]|nr:ABC transporter ATP-binding protein [Acidobacteriota bacterium]
MSSLLQTHDLTVSYGGLHANSNVNIKAEKGKLTGLIGPNGAGKTTFIDAITGFTNISSGRAEFNGADMAGVTPAARAKAGLVRTFQSLELFEDLTVWDNLIVMAEETKWWSFLADIVKPNRTLGVEEQAEWALNLLGLGEFRDRLTLDLSHGQRKLVSVARSLAASPKLLLLDEPAAGLDTVESQQLGSHLREILNHDITIFLIDHDMGLVLSVCDYIYVLDFGKIIAEGTPEEVRNNPEVIKAYLGESAGEMQASEGDAAARALKGEG